MNIPQTRCYMCSPLNLRDLAVYFLTYFIKYKSVYEFLNTELGHKCSYYPTKQKPL